MSRALFVSLSLSLVCGVAVPATAGLSPRLPETGNRGLATSDLSPGNAKARAQAFAKRRSLASLNESCHAVGPGPENEPRPDSVAPAPARAPEPMTVAEPERKITE